MTQLISWFLAGIIGLATGYYVFNQCLDQKKNNISLKTVCLIIVFAVINAYSIVFLKPAIKMVINGFSLIVFFRLVFSQNFSKTFILTIIIYILNGIGEVIVGILLAIFFHVVPINYLEDNMIGILIANIIISLFVLSLCKIPKVLKTVENIVYWYSEKNTLNLVLMTIIGFVSIAVLLYQNYSVTMQKIMFFINNLFILGIIIFMVGFFREKTNNTKLSSEYDQLLEYVKTFEDFFEEGRKERHEYKNQLILIANMIDPNNIKARKYIDKILNKDSPNKKGSKWLTKLQNIPNASIRGFIHYKIVSMEQMGLNVYVEINKEVKQDNIKNILDEELRDVSRILGVYIDNAIEAASKSELKYLIIEVKCDNDEIIFSISNTYAGIIDISKMDKSGYTTKGRGKGYGLSLVNDIIKKNKILNQKRMINGSYFIQQLVIDNIKDDLFNQAAAW